MAVLAAAQELRKGTITDATGNASLGGTTGVLIAVGGVYLVNAG